MSHQRVKGKSCDYQLYDRSVHCCDYSVVITLGGGKVATVGIRVIGYLQNVAPTERHTPAHISILNMLDLDKRAFGLRDTKSFNSDQVLTATQTQR